MLILVCRRAGLPHERATRCLVPARRTPRPASAVAVATGCTTSVAARAPVTIQKPLYYPTRPALLHTAILSHVGSAYTVRDWPALRTVCASLAACIPPTIARTGPANHCIRIYTHATSGVHSPTARPPTHHTARTLPPAPTQPTQTKHLVSHRPSFRPAYLIIRPRTACLPLYTIPTHTSSFSLCTVYTSALLYTFLHTATYILIHTSALRCPARLAPGFSLGLGLDYWFLVLSPAFIPILFPLALDFQLVVLVGYIQYTYS